MKSLLYIITAVTAYLTAGINPAIELSKRVYHKDIRELGSGNPGFTNFKRNFNGPLAWLVLLIDLAKSAIVTAVFAHLFNKYMGNYSLGAAYTCMFAMLGHAFPIWYKFKGGKGFLVYMSAIWFIDWRSALTALIIMLLLLLTVKYMSLATVIAMLSCPITLVVMHESTSVIIYSCLCSAFMAVRHKENFIRLINGTEKKFVLIH